MGAHMAANNVCHSVAQLASDASTNRTKAILLGAEVVNSESTKQDSLVLMLALTSTGSRIVSPSISGNLGWN